MKENQIVINDKNTIKRRYLQMIRPPRFLPVIIAVLIVFGAALWIFTGKMTVSVTGYCAPSETSVVFMLPINYKDKIHSKDVIWVGNHSGTIEQLYSDSYITYEDLCESNDIVFRNFLNSGKCSEDMSYILGSAVFKDNITGMTDYRIVIDTLTPYQRLTGRFRNDR